MVDINLTLGYFSYISRILLLLPLLLIWNKPKLNKIQAKWIVFAIVGGIIIYITGLFIWEKGYTEKDIFDKVLFTLLLAPVFEEMLYRYLLLGTFLEIAKEKIRLMDFYIFIYIGAVLLIPDFIFYSIGWVTNKPDYTLFAFILSVPILIFIKNNYNKIKLINYFFDYFDYYLIIMVAMAFLLSHNVFASQSQFVGGLFFGFLYYKSRNLLPPIIGHFVYNLLTLISQTFK